MSLITKPGSPDLPGLEYGHDARDEADAPTTADVIVTLVHGTFSRKAKWAKQGSPLRTSIVEKFSGTDRKVAFRRFRWSGCNSPSRRSTAAKRLEKKLLNQIKAHPAAKHFVVAHSHGGNVAYYAMRNRQLKRHISGVVTMGTPFLLYSPRDLRFAIYMLIATVAAAVIPYASNLNISHFFSQSTWYYWLISAIGLRFALRVLAYPVAFVVGKIGTTFLAFAKRRRSIYRKLRLGRIPDGNALVATIDRDEAAIWLKMSGGLVDRLPLILLHPCLCAGIALYVFLLLLSEPAVSSQLLYFPFSEWNDVFRAAFFRSEGSLHNNIAVVWASALVSARAALIITGLWILGVLAFLSIWKYLSVLTVGTSSDSPHLLFKLKISGEITGMQGAHLVKSSPKFAPWYGLSHCHIYNDKQTLDSIGTWLDYKSSQPLLAEYQSGPSYTGVTTGKNRNRFFRFFGVNTALLIAATAAGIHGVLWIAGFVYGRVASPGGASSETATVEAVSLVLQYSRDLKVPAADKVEELIGLMTPGARQATAKPKPSAPIRVLQCAANTYSFDGSSVAVSLAPKPDAMATAGTPDAHADVQRTGMHAATGRLLSCRYGPPSLFPMTALRMGELPGNCGHIKLLAWHMSAVRTGFSAGYVHHPNCNDPLIDAEIRRKTTWEDAAQQSRAYRKITGRPGIGPYNTEP